MKEALICIVAKPETVAQVSPEEIRDIEEGERQLEIKEYLKAKRENMNVERRVLCNR